MLGGPPVAEGETTIAPRQELPTACIAVRREWTRFDEDYMGSGWEDTCSCARLRGIFPGAKFLVDGRVNVIHRNEQKMQGQNFRRNHDIYVRMWGLHPFFDKLGV